MANKNLSRIDALTLPYVCEGQEDKSDDEIVERVLRSLEDTIFIASDDDDDQDDHASVNDGASWYQDALILCRERFKNKIPGLVAFPAKLLRECRESVIKTTAEVRRLRDLKSSDLEKEYARHCDVALHETQELEQADWEKWLSCPSWNAEEVTALLFGKDPTALNSKTTSPDWARYAFCRRYERVIRSIDAGMLPIGITLTSLRTWSRKSGFELLDQLNTSEDTGSPKEKDIHHHTKRLFHEILLFLAVSHYGFKPFDSRHEALQAEQGQVSKSHVPQAISDDLRKLDFNVNPKSIRKHLYEAVARVSKDGGDAKLKALAKDRKIPTNDV